jgi:hypothetical protein
MSNLPLATEAWVTIATAVLTGLFGFASGAGLAAMVTTSHERRQRFRERMIERADSVVEAYVEAQGALALAHGGARAIQTWRNELDDAQAQARSAEIQTNWGSLDEPLADASTAGSKMYSQLGHLYVTFPGSAAGDKAVVVHSGLIAWNELLRKARQANDYRQFEAEVNQAREKVQSDRNDFLSELNKQMRKRRL